MIYYFMFAVTLTDPGIIPKIDPRYEMHPELSIIPQRLKNKNNQFFFDSKTVQIKTSTFKLKFCSTCLIYRPPRSSHCPSCDNCIIRFDHHCPWLGTCIGRRNYKYFYTFLILLSILMITTVCTTIQQQVAQSGRFQDIGYTSLRAYQETLKQNPVCIIITLYSSAFAFFVVGLSCFHTFLCFNNLTTNEYIKRQWEINSQNPFHEKNLFKNCFKVMGFLRIQGMIKLKALVIKRNESLEQVQIQIPQPIHSNHLIDIHQSNNDEDSQNEKLREIQKQVTLNLDYPNRNNRSTEQQ